jgi:hypothetical protein
MSRQSVLHRETAALYRRLAEVHEELAADLPEERPKPTDKRERAAGRAVRVPDTQVTEVDAERAARALRRKGFRVV